MSNFGGVGSRDEAVEPRDAGLLAECLCSAWSLPAGISGFPESILPLGAGVGPMALPDFPTGPDVFGPLMLGEGFTVFGALAAGAGAVGVDRDSERRAEFSDRPDDCEGLCVAGADGIGFSEGAGLGFTLGAGAGFGAGVGVDFGAGAGAGRGAGAGLDRGVAAGCDFGGAPFDVARCSDPLSLANATAPVSPKTTARNQDLDIINSLHFRGTYRPPNFGDPSLASRTPCQTFRPILRTCIRATSPTPAARCFERHGLRLTSF